MCGRLKSGFWVGLRGNWGVVALWCRFGVALGLLHVKFGLVELFLCPAKVGLTKLLCHLK